MYVSTGKLLLISPSRKSLILLRTRKYLHNQFTNLLGKSIVFLFRYHRGMKSRFFRRRGFFLLSESIVRYAGDKGSSSRRTTSIESPMFLRSLAAVISSSQLRCGDPDGLLSPERFNRRR